MLIIIINGELVLIVYSEERKENKNARRGKCDRLLTEELASLKTENSDTWCDLTEELASIKTENNAIVKKSVNLVTEPKKLLNSLPNNQPNDKIYNKEAVSQRNQIVPWSSECMS